MSSASSAQSLSLPVWHLKCVVYRLCEGVALSCLVYNGWQSQTITRLLFCCCSLFYIKTRFLILQLINFDTHRRFDHHRYESTFIRCEIRKLVLIEHSSNLMNFFYEFVVLLLLSLSFWLLSRDTVFVK